MKSLGNEGEAIAVEHLKKLGYTIIDRNYTTPAGEADIVAMDRETVVFVEVKTRKSEAFGRPFEAVNHKKQEKLKKVALYFLKQKKQELPVRFDVISIIIADGRPDIEHLEGAF
ncbi:MAG: YraN family protein [Nitrospirae bacterium]|nr:MAG: YraN family protein [Nitrospirota bacterium]